jgi:Ala-tRNA(Pro) deacylase
LGAGTGELTRDRIGGDLSRQCPHQADDCDRKPLRAIAQIVARRHAFSWITKRAVAAPRFGVGTPRGAAFAFLSSSVLQAHFRYASPMASLEAPVLAHLANLGITVERHEHPPVATADEGREHWAGIEAVHCKNLFLRNQRGDRHYLVILRATKRADLRAVAAQIGDGKLSFASPERLMTYLGVTPGSVSPFGLLHDTGRHVRVYLDRELAAASRVSFHPNINTVTLVLTFADFKRFLAERGHRVEHIEVGQGGQVGQGG